MAFIQGAGSKVVIQKSEDGTKKIQLPITSEALNPGGTFANSNAIFGSRVRGIGAKVNPTADGSTDVELWMGVVPVIFYAALGNKTSSGTGKTSSAGGDDVPITYTITPHIDGVPAFDIWVRHYIDTEYQYKITSAVVNSLRVALATDTPWTGTLDWIGLSWVKDSTTDLSSLAYDIESKSTDIIFQPNLVLFQMGSIDLLNYTTSMEFTITNNIDADRFKLDGSGRFAVLPGDLEITGTLTVVMPDSSDSLGAILSTLDIGSTLSNISIKYEKVNSDVTHDVVDEETGELAADATYTFAWGGEYTSITVEKSTDGTTYTAAEEGTDYTINTNTSDHKAILTNVSGGALYFRIDYSYHPIDDVKVDLQNIYVTGLAHDVGGRGAVEYRIDFMCVKDGSDQPIIVTAENNSVSDTVYDRFVIE